MPKTEFIAEVSSNHNKDLERAKQFIKVASQIGCTGVKFQLFKIDELFAPEILRKSPAHQKRVEWELPVEFIPVLSNYAHSFNLKFGCTPFYLKAVDEIKTYVDFFKIASYELLWTDLLTACADTKIPVVLSTGMANLDEVETALKMVSNSRSNDVTILHCTSAYPTPIEQANLSAIDTMRNIFSTTFPNLKLKIGYSDHSVSPAVMYKAVHHYDVSMVEFHLDLDKKGEEFSGGHCWLPEDIEKVIKIVKEGETAEGNGRIEPSEIELHDRDWRADPDDGLRPLKNIRNNYK